MEVPGIYLEMSVLVALSQSSISNIIYHTVCILLPWLNKPLFVPA